MGNKPPGSEGFEMPQPLGAQPNQNNLPYQQQQLPQSDHDQAPIIQQTTSAEIATNPNMAQLDQYPNNNGQNMNPYAANNNMNPYSPQQQQYQPNHHQQPPHNYQQQQPQQQPMQQQQQPQQQQQQQQHAMNTNYNNMGPGAPDVSNQPNEEMQAVGGRCTQVSCRCKAFTESQSKWSKGKCKSCNHTEAQHKQAASAEFGFEQNKVANAPKQNTNVQNLNIGYPSDSKPQNMMYNAPQLPQKPQKKERPPLQNHSSNPNQSAPQSHTDPSQNFPLYNSNPPQNNAYNNGHPPSQQNMNKQSSYNGSVVSPTPTNASNYNHNPQNNPYNNNNNRQPSQQSMNNANYNQSQSNVNNMNNPNMQSNTYKAFTNQTYNPKPRSNSRNPPNRPQPAASPRGAKPKWKPMPQKPAPHHGSFSANTRLPAKKALPVVKPRLQQPAKRSMDLTGFASLRANPIQAKNKESVMMDMTIAEVERMQAKQGNLGNKIQTQNLDKTKTVRQILEEQKQLKSTQREANTIVAALKTNPNQGNQPPPTANPWGAGSGAWNNALGPNANANPNGPGTNNSNAMAPPVANNYAQQQQPGNSMSNMHNQKQPGQGHNKGNSNVNENNAMAPPVPNNYPSPANSMNNLNQNNNNPSNQNNKTKPPPIQQPQPPQPHDTFVPPPANGPFVPPGPPVQQPTTPITPVNTNTPTTRNNATPTRAKANTPKRTGRPHNLTFQPNTRMRANSDQSSVSGATPYRPKPRPKQNYNPPQHMGWTPPNPQNQGRNKSNNNAPQNSNRNKQQQPPKPQLQGHYSGPASQNRNGPVPGNRNFQPKPFNPKQFQPPQAKPANNANSFKPLSGFNPTTAGGLQAKSVGQKMGSKGLTHQEVRQPQQNPRNQGTPAGNSGFMPNQNPPTRPSAYRPPPPKQGFQPQYQGQKYNHNFKNKSYNKKEVRQKMAQKQQKQAGQYPPPEVVAQRDGTNYDSDESVFVTQAEIARRHSWGSSSLEPNVNRQPFGKPVYVGNGQKPHEAKSHMDDTDDPDTGPALTEQELVDSLELTEKEFYKKYWIEDGTVGTGSFAKVRKVTRKKDKKEFALKMIKKAGKSKEDLEALQREIA
eukprot:407211_1